MAKSDVLVRMKADTQNYDANIAKARRQLDQFKRDNLSMGGAMKQLSGNLVATAARFASVTAAVGALGAAFKSNIETARNFEKSMSQLSSLTGMVGSDLDKLKEYAIELGSTTTLSASQVADAFKMIGSQQPQLLASGEALKAVTKNAITLAEAAGIELADAAKTLSVSINQMGGESANAERYINVLAAAAQKGAGDIVWLGEAITKSGTTAKAVGTDYEELVANLEQLAKAGYDASTAGTALRSIIMNLEKQANQQYKPSVVGLTEAFKNLGEANLTLTEYQGIAGKMFAAQAKALADAAGEAENMTTQITGTNIAEEQAKTNTDNLDGSLKALSSAWEGFNLHLNSSNGLFRDMVDGMKDLVTWLDKTRGKLDDLWNKYGWMLNPSKEGAQENFARLAAEKYGNAEDVVQNVVTGTTTGTIAGGSGTGGGGGGGGTIPKKTKSKKTELTELQINQRKINSLTQEYIKLGDQSTESAIQRQEEIRKEIQLLQQRNGLLGLRAEQAQGRMLLNAGDMDKTGLGNLMANPFAGDDKKTGGLKLTLDESAMKAVMDGVQKSLPKQKELFGDSKKLVGGLSNIASGLQQMGVELPDEVNQIIGVAQGLMTVIEGVNTIIGMTQTPALVANTIAMDALTTALWTTGFFGFARGGVVPHAAGGFAGMVPGNHFSGDVTPIMANAGEVVLNRAQAGVLAASFENQGGGGGGYTPSHVSGEQIWIALNAYTRRTGKGELVTWR